MAEAEDENLTKKITGKNIKDFKAANDKTYINQKQMTVALALKANTQAPVFTGTASAENMDVSGSLTIGGWAIAVEEET